MQDQRMIHQMKFHFSISFLSENQRTIVAQTMTPDAGRQGSGSNHAKTTVIQSVPLYITNSFHAFVILIAFLVFFR